MFRSSRPNLPKNELRVRIADAVNDAVAEVVGDSGQRDCLFYAVVGSEVCSALLGREYRVVIGTLVLSIESGNDTVVVVNSDNARKDGGEYHAFIICERGQDSIEVVDLSARHYPSWLHEFGREWRWGEVPSFVWCWHDSFPKYVQLLPNNDATRRYAQTYILMNMANIERCVAVTFKSLGIPQVN